MGVLDIESSCRDLLVLEDEPQGSVLASGMRVLEWLASHLVGILSTSLKCHGVERPYMARPGTPTLPLHRRGLLRSVVGSIHS